MNSVTIQLHTPYTAALLPDLRQGEGGEEGEEEEREGEEEEEEVGVIVSVGHKVQNGQGMKVIMASQCRTTALVLASNITPHLPTAPQMGRIKTMDKPTQVSSIMNLEKLVQESTREAEMQESH